MAYDILYLKKCLRRGLILNAPPDCGLPSLKNIEITVYSDAGKKEAAFTFTVTT